jgi:hypothetical protein
VLYGGRQFSYLVACMQELEKELAREQEKNKKVNLTEAAAQKSSQILEQTKASTHVGAGLLVLTHVVYLMIGVFSILASGLMDVYDRIES